MTSTKISEIDKKMEVSEAPVDNIATLNEAHTTADEAPAIGTTPNANAAIVDPYVNVLKKDIRKKDIQLEDAEFINAKTYLSTKLGVDSVSMYDHLTNLVSHLLERKPDNSLGKKISFIHQMHLKTCRRRLRKQDLRLISTDLFMH